VSRAVPFERGSFFVQLSKVWSVKSSHFRRIHFHIGFKVANSVEHRDGRFMKHTVMAFFALISFSFAHANVFTCTSNSSTASYDTATKEITVINEKKEVSKISNITIVVKGIKLIELQSQDGKKLATLTMDGKGYDMATDLVYPYSADIAPEVFKADSTVTAGCETNFVHAHKPQKD
jgi:hypothetical protein